VQMSTHEHLSTCEQWHMNIYGHVMAHGISHQLRRAGFNYRPVYVGFEEGKVKVKQVSRQYFGFLCHHFTNAP
jgi:hypothetical protein